MTATGDECSFGALLQTFRKQVRFTQQALAQALGVHRRTLVRWEQGDYLPASKALVLELARHLKLDDQQTRQLLEASLKALAPHWVVPLPRNPYFTGRAEVLEMLHAQLGVRQTATLIQSSALHGLGGIGKTQVALEYAYRYALEYSAVFWIGAETEEQIISSFLHVAEVLQLFGQTDQDVPRVVAAVQHWLSVHGQWLLIWDNVEDLAVLDRFLPVSRPGAVLITTRCQALGTLAQGIGLSPMGQEEGILFLLRRAKLLSLKATSEDLRHIAETRPTEYTAALELVEATGGLPLALDQAGAYLEETRCRLPAYLELFRTRRAALLHLRGKRAHEHPDSVSTTFTLALRATVEPHPTVLDLLRVCALLQSAAVPEEFFHQGGMHLGTQLEAACRDQLEWDRIVSAACSYSLLARQPEEGTLSLHRLAQAVLLDGMTEEERENWTWRTLRALEAAFPEVLPTTAYSVWRQCERLMPHALLYVQHPGNIGETQVWASLSYKVAQYLCQRGQYQETEPFYLRALQVQEQTLGSAHPAVASTLTGLANSYRNRGDYTRAESLHLRALRIREQTLGSTHPAVASSLNGLANLYSDQGKYRELEALRKRALQIQEQVLGSDHPDVAASLNNLALLYRDQGKYAEAETLYQHALTIFEQTLGPDDPKVALVLQNLANLSRDQGKYAEAEALYQRALWIYEQALGTGHYLVSSVFNNLANLSQDQGKYAEAEALYQRALWIYEQALGSEHPWLTDVLNGLANLYRDMEKYVEAEALYQRALSIQEKRVAFPHPDTAHTLYNLALLRQQQGQLSEAIALAECALQIRTQMLGETHPKTVATHALYSQLVQEQTASTGPTLERLRSLLQARGWSLHLKQRRSKPYAYATRKVGEHTQSRYLAPLSNLAACLAAASTLPNVRKEEKPLVAQQ